VTGANPPGQSPPSIIVGTDKRPSTFREGVVAGAELALYVQAFRTVAALEDAHILYLGGVTHRVPSLVGKAFGPITGFQLRAGSLVTDSAALGSFFVTPRPFGLLPPRVIGLAPDYNRGFNPYATGVKAGGRVVLETVALLEKLRDAANIPVVIGLEQAVTQAAIDRGAIRLVGHSLTAGADNRPSVNPKDP
jgi:hypothetical protein